MSARTFGPAVVAFAAVLAVAPAGPPDRPGSAGGRDWPMFGGGPGRNMVNLADRNLPIEFGAGPDRRPNVKWVAKLGSRAYGGPVVTGGKVFVGTNNQSPRNPRDFRQRKDGKSEPIDKSVLMCFRESDGQFLWQHVNDKLPSGLVHDWPEEGICSTPAVEGNRLYYVSNRCEVVCLDVAGFADGNQGVRDEKYTDPTDADVIWRLDMMKELGVFPHNQSACHPLVVDDLIFVVTGNGVDENHINIPSPEAPSFIAVDKHTGKVVWQSNAPGRNIMHGQWSHPAYAVAGGRPQVIFPGGDGWLYAFDPPTGRLLWRFDANPKDAVYVLGPRCTKNAFVCAPAVHGGRACIGVGHDPEHVDGVGHLWCIDLARAVELGRTNPGRDVSPGDKRFDPADPANRASALVWHYGGFAPHPEKDGRDYVFGRTLSTCAVHDGLCYACDLGGFFTCLDAKTGRKLWDHDTKGEVWSSPYWVDGKVYLGTADGDVWVFRHGREKQLLAQVEVGQAIKAPIVAANGVLYVVTESQLLAVAGP
ncbi:MAG TPA: PQQ-binding-like beta-propeller repeat protein [Gemmataceae bacterium]|jgi:outer membrane protein assembly factor BamB